MSLKLRTVLQLGLTLLFMTIIVAVFSIGMRTYGSMLDYYSNRFLPAIQDTKDIHILYLESDLALIDFAHTGKQQNKVDQSIDALLTKFNAYEKYIRAAITPDNDPANTLAGLDISRAGINSFIKSYEDLKQNGYSPGWDSQHKAFNTRFNEHLDSINSGISKIIASGDLKISETRSVIIKVITGVSIVLILFTLTFGLLMARSLNKSVQKFSQNIDTITQGDLTISMDDKAKDEFGKIGGFINYMLEHLREVFAGLQVSGRDLIDISLRFSESGKNMLERSETQTQQADSLASAMNEMSSTVKEVAENAQLTASEAKDAENQAKQGQLVVGKSVQKSTEVSQEIESINEKVINLKEQTTNISTVIDVIKGIAEQTNLLALNAAIEAARAGEQGRGFAVVADEVRALASKTQESADEVVQVIERLQSGANSVSENVKTAVDSVAENEKSSQLVQESLNQITSSVSRISDMNTQVASNAREQAIVAEDMNKSIAEISDAASDNFRNFQDITADIERIKELSDCLKVSARKFKT